MWKCACSEARIEPEQEIDVLSHASGHQPPNSVPIAQNKGYGLKDKAEVLRDPLLESRPPIDLEGMYIHIYCVLYTSVTGYVVCRTCMVCISCNIRCM